MMKAVQETEKPKEMVNEYTGERGRRDSKHTCSLPLLGGIRIRQNSFLSSVGG